MLRFFVQILHIASKKHVSFAYVTSKNVIIFAKTGSSDQRKLCLTGNERSLSYDYCTLRFSKYDPRGTKDHKYCENKRIPSTFIGVDQPIDGFLAVSYVSPLQAQRHPTRAHKSATRSTLNLRYVTLKAQKMP